MFNKILLLLLLLIENHLIFGELLCSVGKCICKRDIYKNFPVTIVDCYSIGLDEFPNKTQVIHDLNIFDLSSNRIKQLKQQNFTSYSLNVLKLSYNRLQLIDSDFFTDLPNLQELYLDHNQISEINDRRIFEKLTNLMYLDLSSNNLKQIAFGVFVEQQNLKYLDLSYNKDLATTWLNVSENYLNDNLAINTNITHLRLNQINLNNLPYKFFNDYKQLEYVTLTDNNFDNVPNLPYSVEYLDLSGTRITVLQAKYFNYHQLKILKLNRLKQLVSIHKYAFYNLQSLEELSINNCKKLREFNELVFGLLSRDSVLKLRKLSLSGNSLSKLNYTYQYLFDKLEFIDLSYNRWLCDCDLIWLQEYRNLLHNTYNLRCSSPSPLKRKLLLDINDEDVPDCYPEKYGKRAHRIILPILLVLIVILTALIAYLIFYAPNWYGGRSKTVGPQSPYNPTRLEED